ncbi:MAG: T9SS type A sorting domain-containing protein [Saprospiraceae bacterium]|nr:T9SS type A sorting domain-containing protein [Saprospiraceae bacterium]
MQGILSLILILLVCGQTLSQNPVPNFSFENWTNSEPDDWFTSNVPEDSIYPVLPIMPGFASNLAIGGTVVPDPANSGSVLSPLIESNTSDFGFEVDREYPYFSLYYTFEPHSNDDFLAVNISVLDNQGSIYGSGYLELSSPQEFFTRVDIPIIYGEGNPAKAIISFTVGNRGESYTPAVGTNFTIDELSLNDQTTSIDLPRFDDFEDFSLVKSGSTELSISFITSRSLPFSLAIYNNLGQISSVSINGKSQTGKNQYHLDLPGLCAGIYHCQIQYGKFKLTRTFQIY